MLNQVLREMQAARGTLRLDELAARLNIEPSALEGMIAFWVSKARLKPVSIESDTENCAVPCARSCPGVTQCPFVAKMPKMWERISRGEKKGGSRN
ncbi:MAG: FeoC-like transcriptional regulator [Chloroflexi bacterium]|nr:FeoC-like transcriptional regulator [Chloroflexota bacterium]